MTSTRKNTLALVVLMILLGVTLEAAYLDLGVLHTPAAMLIGLAKAVLIVLIFMRLRPSEPLVMLAFTAGLFWLLIMFTLTLGDYFTRS
ncbi:MAG TPA: cytochrome C oxidase subunit IV family protein [Terrimicrobiaceae bacterium]